jgi:tetratricopeptide (TPR) repeat protein
MPEPTFVGRKQYVEQFRELLNAPPDSPYILNLHGPGGIGKTKILQRFVEICEEEKIPHTGIIDFYGFEMSSRISAVEQKIAKALKGSVEKDPFEIYWQLREKLQSETPHIRGLEFKRQFMNSLSEWAESLVAEGKRGVLIFDTLESVRYTLVGTRLLDDWLPNLNHALVVLAGRQEEGEINFLPQIADKVIHAKVDVFDKEEAIDYLKERKVLTAVEEDKATDALFELTRQRPLLLALSADWILNYTVFPSTSPATLVQDADSETFEKKLVENLPVLVEKPESEILPYMAHMITPFDAELIKFLNPNISSNEAETILKNLSELSFVKEFIGENNTPCYWFQDELRTLFHKYVFSDTIAWNQIRRDLSNIMITFYDNQIQQAKQKGDATEEQRAIARRLYHEIYLDPVAGVNKFQKMFQGARDEFQYGFASLLLSPLRFLVDYLPEQQQYIFLLAEGRWLRDMGDAKKAEERFLKLLEKYKDDPREPYILNGLGVTVFNLGRFNEALEYHTKSIELSKKFKAIDLLPREPNNIGNAYLRMGIWKEAIVHFKAAYDIALNQEKSDWNLIATILNSLGNVYGLSGEYEIGIDYVNQAIEILEKLNLPQRLASAKLIRGDIYRRAGRYDEALKDINEAIPDFEELDYQNLATAYLYMGFAQWYKSEAEDDKNLLRESQKSFEICIDMARKYDLVRELPRALHEVSQVYWRLGLKKEARQSNGEAYDLAVKSHDIYYAVNSLVKKAELDYEEDKYEKIPEYARTLRSNFEDQGYKFPLFYGRMDRISADIAFDQKNYHNAFNNYAKGLHLIAQHGGYGKYTLTRELENLEKRLKTLPDNDALNFYKKLKEYWTNQGVDKKNPKMISWADQHISRLAFKIRLG